MPTAPQRVLYKQVGDEPPLYFAEAASQTFKQGDLVGIDANGRVVILVAAGSNWDSTSGTKMLGIALNDASNLAAASATKNIGVQIVTKDTPISLPYWSATPTSAEQQDVIQGKVFVIRNVSGIFVCNADTPANPVVVVRNTNKDYAATEQYVPVDLNVTANLVFSN